MSISENSAPKRTHLAQAASCAALLAYALAAGAQQVATTPNTLLAQETPGPASPGGEDQSAAGTAASPLSEITVTATRRSESIQKVPISVTAITQGQMDTQGIKEFQDIAKYTPGLDIQNTEGGGNVVSIRGISSASGAATTGIYIDDTPIQVRNSGYDPGSAFPSLFDLQRVEVLRGPQGTLFGAGSEGGTVRFILAQPSLTQFKTYVRAEGEHIDHGGNGGEVGASFSGPLIQDHVGFLVSAYYKKQPGYIDAVTGTYSITSPKGLFGANSVDYQQTGLVYPNANWGSTVGLRGALRIVPTDNLTITPSIIYQDRYTNQADDAFFAAGSNPSKGQYNYLASPAGDPATQPNLLAQYGPDLEQAKDRFLLPSLELQLDFGPVSLLYNGSYFLRDQAGWRDYTVLYEFLYGSPTPVPGDHSNGYLPVGQRNLVQELRFQSTDKDARFNWVAGVFFSRNAEYTNDVIGTNFIAGLSPFTLGGPPGVAGGDPFGPGSNAFENYFGYPLIQPYSISFTDLFDTVDKQVAGFAQVDFKITSKLTLTAGIRYSHFSLGLNSVYGGGENNLFPTFGLPCAVVATSAGPCVSGVNPAGQFAETNLSSSGSATTPKLGLTYQINPDDMVYATASKGFRPAGADLLVPEASCSQDLDTIGYLGPDGHSTQPAVYQPDFVWSYELGTKGRLFDGKAVIDASIYQINWSNIQTQVALPCAYTITLNAGHVRSQGADVSLDVAPVHDLNLHGSLGYNRALFTEDSVTPSGKVLFASGTGVPGSGSPLTYALAGDYELPFANSLKPYVHSDWTYHSALRRAGATSPFAANYRPLTVNPGAYDQTNLRAGIRLLDGALDVSAFVNNITDEHPYTSLDYSNFKFYFLGSTIQPRTYGVTMVYRP
jgi:iron complex outermembrane recepter protein